MYLNLSLKLGLSKPLIFQPYIWCNSQDDLKIVYKKYLTMHLNIHMEEYCKHNQIKDKTRYILLQVNKKVKYSARRKQTFSTNFRHSF